MDLQIDPTKGIIMGAGLAMEAHDNIIGGRIDKSKPWRVKTELEYHESN